MKHLTRAWQPIKIASLLVVIAGLIIQEGPPPGATETRISRLVAAHSFDYLGWELEALYAKGAQMAMPVQNYMDEATRKGRVLRYLDLLRRAGELQQQVAEIYSDPHVADPESASAVQRAEYSRLRAELSQMQSTVEGIIEEQVACILAEQGLAVGGQVLPPVKFRFTPLPQQLIISPRTEIRRMYEFSLEAGLTVEQAETLEDELDRRFDVSSLVVPIGGMGLYPAMVLETDSVEWLMGVVAHEWAHNWLTLFPIGWNYGSSAELTTMNETAAGIVENEIRPLALARFYPELVKPPPPSNAPTLTETQAAAPVENPFNFRAFMRDTRIEVDRLLKEGRVTEAEEFMEQRRQLFWAAGYPIRKLNQAYFAFYGAYADEPGAAGDDPVGPAVVQLRRQSPSLKAFLFRLAPMTSFQDLKQAVEGHGRVPLPASSLVASPLTFFR